jgi:hypothetical protein
MAANQKKRLALDTNLLLDLARKSDFAYDFRAVFQAANYSLLAGPTVFRELGFAVIYGHEPEKSLALFPSKRFCRPLHGGLLASLRHATTRSWRRGKFA